LSPPARSLQTTLIPAGGSAVVEFIPPVPGTFLLVDHAIFRLHHGAAGSINVHGQENAEVFEPKTPRNMVPMNEDAHLGHGGDPSASTLAASATAKSPNFTPSASSNDPRTLFAQAGASPATRTAGGATIKMLPGSGIWKKGKMQTFLPTTVTIKLGQ